MKRLETEPRLAALLDGRQSGSHPEGTLHIRFQRCSDFLNLSRFVVDAISPGAFVLDIDEHGVWPSSENWFLFDSLSLQLFGAVHRVRAMQFDDTEREAALSFLQIALQFGWGGIFMANESRYFRFSHDEVGKICGRIDAEHVSSLRRLSGISVIGDRAL